MAKIHKKEIGNGKSTSLWYDRWSELWVLSNLLGERGIIELGVQREATLDEALQNL